MTTHNSRLSELEWEVMDVIWKLGGKPSVRDVLSRAYPNGEKAYTTVQTVMNNLERKGYLFKEKENLVNHYYPAKKRPDTIQRETVRFVSRVFGGSFHALANFLIDSDSLSDEEIIELRKLLEEKEA